jgi:hypothetical protein
MTGDDLAALREPAARPNIQKIRDAHHNVARLMALGLRQDEIAARTGYSLGRINQLAADSAIHELVESYRGRIDEAYVKSADAFAKVCTSNMMKAARQVSETLDGADEQGEQLPVRELMLILGDGADRFGYGKHATNLNINVDFAAKLEAAIVRSNRKLAEV